MFTDEIFYCFLTQASQCNGMFLPDKKHKLAGISKIKVASQRSISIVLMSYTSSLTQPWNWLNNVQLFQM